MLGLGKLWNAVSTLAASVTNLAATVDSINAGLKERIGLEQKG